MSADQLLSGSVDRTVRVEYKNNAEFMQLAQRIGIMADLKVSVIMFIACMSFFSCSSLICLLVA